MENLALGLGKHSDLVRVERRLDGQLAVLRLQPAGERKPVLLGIDLLTAAKRIMEILSADTRLKVFGICADGNAIGGGRLDDMCSRSGDFVTALYDFLGAILSVKQYVIAAFNQAKILGGGFGVFGPSDLRIAWAGMKLRSPEQSALSIPFATRPFIEPRVNKPELEPWLESGDWFSAQQAQAIGLFDHLFKDRDQLNAVLVRYAKVVIAADLSRVRVPLSPASIQEGREALVKALTERPFRDAALASGHVKNPSPMVSPTLS